MLLSCLWHVRKRRAAGAVLMMLLERCRGRFRPSADNGTGGDSQASAACRKDALQEGIFNQAYISANVLVPGLPVTYTHAYNVSMLLDRGTAFMPMNLQAVVIFSAGGLHATPDEEPCMLACLCR